MTANSSSSLRTSTTTATNNSIFDSLGPARALLYSASSFIAGVNAALKRCAIPFRQVSPLFISGFHKRPDRRFRGLRVAYRFIGQNELRELLVKVSCVRSHLRILE